MRLANIYTRHTLINNKKNSLFCIGRWRVNSFSYFSYTGITSTHTHGDNKNVDRLFKIINCQETCIPHTFIVVKLCPI
jgi:hypothetical protein